ncbi:alpha/beta hydrolase [Marinomonas sp. A79]|uniref:Alpha/beta hydrolase n=1 Tax=Marinomonas vulgaris TaxID=2823372 RepID=A0ABS5HF79_9GAMM|nr:alpha/beta hydrolase [Marinomonas vulgaris]MBR7890207.1 alpha/beta hydrolase [Marinomonas vulgaris]
MTKHKLLPWLYPVEEGHIQGYTRLVDDTLSTIHFLHGNGFAVNTYIRFLEQLEGYNLVLQDAAGHGESTAGSRFLGWNETAERFSAALMAQKANLPRTKVIGMGHSFGGCMTALMSAQDPELFDRLVLLDPALFPPRLIWMMRGVKFAGLKSRLPLARQARRRRTQWDSIEQAKNSFYERGTFKGWEPECLDDYLAASLKQVSTGQYHLRCPTWMEEAIFSSYPKGLWPAIKNITVPTYLLQGKNTYDYFKESYQLAARLNPNIRVIEVEGGHCFMQEDTTGIAAKVMSILRENP